MSSVYAGASFETVVSGTTSVSANFLFSPQGFGLTPKIAVSVNGGNYTRKNMADSVVLASGLNPNNSYTIKVVYDGPDPWDNVWEHSRTITLKDLTLDSGGSYIPTSNTKKNILFVGDSITAGVYSLSSNPEELGSSAIESYPTEIAKRLNINDYRAGFGGAGVTKPGIIGLKVQDYVQLDMKEIRSNDNIHTVVMVVGTNDNPFDTDPAVFKTAYQSLISKVRELYPTQRIYLVDIPTGNGSWSVPLKELVAENPKCTFIPTVGWQSQISTTDGLHPDANGAKKLGQLISDAMVLDRWDIGGGQTPVPVETNLWEAPTSFSPLPLGWGFQTGAQMDMPGSYAGKSFRLTFKAKSASGQKLKFYTEFKANFDNEVVLTDTFTEYSRDFTVTYSSEGNFLVFINQTGMEDGTIVSDIHIKDIYVKEI